MFIFKKIPDIIKYPQIELTELPHIYRRTNDEWFGFTLLAIVGGIIIILLSAMIYDVGGRDATEHPYTMPSSVDKLSPTQYIIHSGSKENANSICWGSASNTDLNVITRSILTINGTLVQCGRSQSFNKNYPKQQSLRFGKSLALALQSFWTYAVLIPFLLLVLVPFNQIAKQRHNRMWVYHIKMRQFEAQKGLEEQRLREVVQAWARCDIDREEYDAALERAYMAGVKRAE